MHYLKKMVTSLCCFLLVNIAMADVLLKDMDGKQIPFSSLKGKWVMINYWASWCQPCVDEIKELNKFYQTHKERVALYAVNFDALPIKEQLQLIRMLGIHYPGLIENPGAQLGLGHIRGVPATFVFDPQGNLSDTLYGAQTQASLDEAITSKA